MTTSLSNSRESILDSSMVPGLNDLECILESTAPFPYPGLSVYDFLQDFWISQNRCCGK